MLIFRRCRSKLCMGLLKWKWTATLWLSRRPPSLDRSLAEKYSKYKKWNISALPHSSHPKIKSTSLDFNNFSPINSGISQISMTSPAPSNNLSTTATPSKIKDSNTCTMPIGSMIFSNWKPTSGSQVLFQGLSISASPLSEPQPTILC